MLRGRRAEDPEPELLDVRAAGIVAQRVDDRIGPRADGQRCGGGDGDDDGAHRLLQKGGPDGRGSGCSFSSCAPLQYSPAVSRYFITTPRRCQEGAATRKRSIGWERGRR